MSNLNLKYLEVIPPRGLLAIAEIIKGSINRNFTQGGRYDSTDFGKGGGSNKFAPLKKETIAARKRRGRSAKSQLLDTGQLRTSIQVISDGNKLRISSNKAYSAVHHFGHSFTQNIKVTDKMRKFFWAKHFAAATKKDQDKYKAMALTKKQTFERKITIPARPYLVLQEEDYVEIAATLADVYAGL